MPQDPYSKASAPQIRFPKISIRNLPHTEGRGGGAFCAVLAYPMLTLWIKILEILIHGPMCCNMPYPKLLAMFLNTSVFRARPKSLGSEI